MPGIKKIDMKYGPAETLRRLAHKKFNAPVNNTTFNTGWDLTQEGLILRFRFSDTTGNLRAWPLKDYYLEDFKSSTNDSVFTDIYGTQYGVITLTDLENGDINITDNGREISLIAIELLAWV